MPVAVAVLVFGALLIFSWRQFRDRAHEGWRPYQGAGLYKTTPTTPDGITSGHYEHVHISATSNDEVWPPPYRLQVYGAAEVGYVLEQDDRQLVPCRTAPGSASCRAPTCKPAASATCSPWTTGQPGITFVTGRRDASSLRLLSTAPVNTARHRSPERLLTNPDVAFADAARPLPRSSPKYLEPGGTATFPSAAGHRLLLGPSRRILPRTPSADEHDRAGAGEPSFVENRPLAGSSWGEVDHV